MSAYTNFFFSGFSFDENEDLLKFKFKMINYILVVVCFFSFLFGVLSDLGINDIGEIHSKVDYVYSALTLGLIFFLRNSKQNYLLVARLLLTFSLVTFISALIFVVQDEFRMIWFYLLILVAYILAGVKDGIFFTVASIVCIALINFFVDLQISSLALNSSILGMIIGSSISLIYTNKINGYEKALQDKTYQLHYLATTDGLTGIMNKRTFDVAIRHDFELMKRTKVGFSLMLLDIDHFKNINDMHGHSFGDKVIVQYASIIQNFLRKSDLFSRIGGDEFAIILYETNIDHALEIARKINQKIQDTLLEIEHHSIQITTSIGVSQTSADDDSFEAIFKRADDALYESKHKGRNLVNVA